MKIHAVTGLAFCSCSALGSALGSALVLAQVPVSEQFDPDNPPEIPDVEIVGHILKPAPVELGSEEFATLNMPEGFAINVFAQDLKNPRMLAVHESGNVYVTRRSIGDVVLLVDEDKNGEADEKKIVANRPNMHGIAIDGDTLFLVTNHDIYRTQIQSDGSLAELERIVDDLPDAGQHPNRTVVVGPDGLLYVSVGSTCNACDEPNPENATLLQVQPDGSSRKIFASGLRNTIGFGFVPGTETLYGMDHGIDWLGDNEQHEELNHIVEGKQYGWPYIYEDGKYNPADKPPGKLTWADWEAQSENPVGLYVPHAAPMQLAFYTGDKFPEEYRGDAFVAMRGSWNRKPPSGYEIIRIDFDGSSPKSFAPFITGFLTQQDGDWHHRGRLAGMAQAQDGSLLFTDDEHGIIYRVSYSATEDEQHEPTPIQPTNPEGATMTISAGDSLTPDTNTIAQLAIEALETGEGEDFTTSSPAFDDGNTIPAQYAAEQENFSPPVQWQQGPEGTESYALIMEDPDAPGETPFVHWLVYNIPADTEKLHPGVPGRLYLDKPEGALQGKNSRGSIGYFGPRPPVEDGPHHYHFEVFALDTSLDLKQGATRDELIEAMRGHVLAADQFVGTYER